MKVENLLVYRVFTPDKGKDLKVGEFISTPTERDNSGLPIKINAEELLEDIRKESYENLPSRNSVLFVFPYDENIVREWVGLMSRDNDCDYILCTLRITGDIIWCNQDNYTNAGQFDNPQIKQNYATKYWSTAGDTYDSFETPEGLFQGKAVIEKIEQKHYTPQGNDVFDDLHR